MKKSIKKKFSALMCATLLASTAVSVGAATFGNGKCGASNVEVLQVRYNGAAWNYSGSGYKWASFTYTRNGRTLMKKTVNQGRVSGSVWDDLIHWDDAHTTHFYWNCG